MILEELRKLNTAIRMMEYCLFESLDKTSADEKLKLIYKSEQKTYTEYLCIRICPEILYPEKNGLVGTYLNHDTTEYYTKKYWELRHQYDVLPGIRSDYEYVS